MAVRCPPLVTIPCLLLVVLVALLAASSPAFGEPVTTVLDNGPSSNRVDIVILGDGYASADQQKLAADTLNVVNGLFSQEPLREYQRYFNVHRVDIVSNESGSDHPASDVFKDTALDSAYDCNGIQRLICVNASKVHAILNNSVSADAREIRIVLVNDPAYGGSGGQPAVVSTHPGVVELVLHELGHSFGQLADEYTNSPPSCINTRQPVQVNVTRESSRAAIKWNTGGGPPTGWIDPGTAVPTTNLAAGVPGLFEGAKYCVSGLYRATANSKMRSLGKPFEPINEEQLIKRVYNFVSPLDASLPVASSILLADGEFAEFQVTTPAPLSRALDVIWSVNGAQLGTGTDFVLDAATLPLGINTVEVMVSDGTPRVRNDPAGVLDERRSWQVEKITMHIDSDGDEIPDHVEDANANGVVDPGETDPQVADTDGDGAPDGVEDANRNGVLDAGESQPTVPDVLLSLSAGLNLISLPIEPAIDSHQWLGALGPAGLSISRMNLSGGYDTASRRADGTIEGPAFALTAYIGYLLQFAADAQQQVIGVPANGVPDLPAGTRVRGFSYLPGEMTAFALLNDAAHGGAMRSIGRLNRSSGRFEFALAGDDGAVGFDFPLVRGESYLVSTTGEVALSR